MLILETSELQTRMDVGKEIGWQSLYIFVPAPKKQAFLDLNPCLYLTSPLPEVKIRVKGRIFLFLLVRCPYLCTSHSDRLGSDGAKGWGK